MQILITDSSLVRTRALHFKRWQLGTIAFLLAAVAMVASAAIYHLLIMTAVREGWPLMSPLVKLVVVRDESAQRERFMRENLDAIALRVGEMQAKLVKLEALGERVTGMAGVKTDDLKALQVRGRGGQGGPFVPLDRPSLQQLNEALDRMDERSDIGSDLFTLVESRLFEAKLQAALVPSTHPVEGPVGSGFGFRIDPITGRPALHTGLDFSADVGTPILAAAGGMVVVSETHPAYGRMIEIDHGNSLITRYAHASKLLVKVGTMVKRGQKIAEVGTSGRSTGPHLHFEVLVAGVQQNPVRFLAGKVTAPTQLAEVALLPRKAHASRHKAITADSVDATGAAGAAGAALASPPAPRDEASGSRAVSEPPAAPAPRPAPEIAGDAAP